MFDSKKIGGWLVPTPILRSPRPDLAFSLPGLILVLTLIVVILTVDFHSTVLMGLLYTATREL